MDDLAGRNAFVTGAGSGIGQGIARNLALAGVNVAVADIRKDAAEATAAAIVAAGGRAVPLALDVSDRTDVEHGADQAEQALGPIHIVCNNAGVAMHGVPLEKIAANDWDWAIGVNVYGVIHGIQTFVPRMRAHGEGGHVVNTASIGGLQVNPSFLTSAYSMTKYAVVALSEALEQELEGSGIGVSVLCPAAVATSIHLSERSRPDAARRPDGAAGKPFHGRDHQGRMDGRRGRRTRGRRHPWRRVLHPDAYGAARVDRAATPAY